MNTDLIDQYLSPTQIHQLITAWQEPHRKYHTLLHLKKMLVTLEIFTNAGLEYDRLAVYLAAWFHDAIYGIGTTDNELQSAELALYMLGENPLSAEVYRLIMLTEKHAPTYADINGIVLCDADLAILGGTPNDYAKYARQVREEYAIVPDDIYIPGRINVLKKLLDNTQLFHSDFAYQQWEHRARENLHQEIEKLKNPKTT